MNIRFGIYTYWEGIECKVEEVRSEVPSLAEVVLLTEDSTSSKFEFQQRSDGKTYWKQILLKELTNAYSVRTIGTYKSIQVEVFPKPNSSSIVIIGSSNKAQAEQAGLIQVLDNWYTDDVLLNELNDLKEVYAPALGVPLPLNVPTTKKY